MTNDLYLVHPKHPHSGPETPRFRNRYQARRWITFRAANGSLSERRAHGDPVSAPERVLPDRKELTVVDDLVLRTMLRRQAAILEELEPLVITDLDDVNEFVDRTWRALSDARLSASATQIVAGTKALHHLLAD